MGSLSVQHKLPVIEFTKENLEPGRDSWSKTCRKVIVALEAYGCFVALYDKITEKVHDELLQAVQELFDLPTEIKVKNESPKPFHSYVAPSPFLPLYECTAIGNASTPKGVQDFTKLMWPNGNDRFSETFIQYTTRAAELEKIVVQMVFEGYGVGKYIETYINARTHLCRVMKYSCPDQLNEKKPAFMPHTDKTFMSILHQTNQVNGLEIQAKDGEWFGLEFSPSSAVVIAGDVFMAWSNDRIKSPVHRVTMEGKEPRYSIALFSTVENIVVQTPEELIDEEHPTRFYKPFEHMKLLEFLEERGKKGFHTSTKEYCGV